MRYTEYYSDSKDISIVTTSSVIYNMEKQKRKLLSVSYSATSVAYCIVLFPMGLHRKLTSVMRSQLLVL